MQEISGYYRNLVKGFEQNDIECVFVDLRGHPAFKSTANQKHRILRLVDNYIELKQKFWFKNIPIIDSVLVLKSLLKFIIFIWSLCKFNVYIFGFSSTFMAYYDLPILKLFNKKIIYMCHGSDFRPPYLNGKTLNSCGDLKIIAKETRKKKKIVKKIERYADYIINRPAQAYFNEKQIILDFYIGRPYQGDYTDKAIKKNKYSAIRILHAPSDTLFKGTEIIEAHIEHLKRKGHNIDFIKITNVPNQQVINEIINCDFVIDQVYSDIPMTAIATEAAYYGKPTVIGGYYSSVIYDEVPKQYIIPTIFCHPDELLDNIEKLIVDSEYRSIIGKKLKQYVRDNWKPRQVAERYVKLMDGHYPLSWHYNPNNLSYLYGAGISKELLRKYLIKYISEYGYGALELSDKPALLRRYIEWVGQNRSEYAVNSMRDAKCN